MNEDSLTEGARRALESAMRWAHAAGAAHVEPLHLLWALIGEESRASEILSKGGLTPDVLQSLCPIVPVPDNVLDAATTTKSPPLLPQSDTAQSVLTQAERLVADAGGTIEIGTEHLLWGLSVVESEVSGILQKHQLDPDSLAAAAARHTGVDTAPIDVDFSLKWQNRTTSDQSDTLRIIDAAANRAREGLRVLEDFVRFALDDAHLTRTLKESRHALFEALKSIRALELLAARDTQHDVGTEIATDQELARSSSSDVVQANFKRVQEAFRTLEEFSKLLEPAVGRRIEELRYRLYTLEKAVICCQWNRQRFDGRDLYLLVTEESCHHGSGPAIREALAAGVAVVQVREKSMSDRRLIEHADRVRQWTREADALFIMNDRPDLAVLTDADGVHVGQDELTVKEARRIVGADRLVGVSTHSIEQARQAVLDGADYLGVGPVFASKTKDFQELPGLDFVRQAAAEISLPWFAIGGIDATNIEQVLDAGAHRVAVSNAICAAEHPREAASQLVSAVKHRAAR